MDLLPTIQIGQHNGLTVENEWWNGTKINHQLLPGLWATKPAMEKIL